MGLRHEKKGNHLFSRPPEMQGVGALHTQPGKIPGVMRNSSNTVWRFNGKQRNVYGS
jgi:hypothetical protein